jgi:hypothetical protein
MLSRLMLLGTLAFSYPALAFSAERPIVVELFTSQGCSSCPPADTYLTELSHQHDILPLAFHVTYWNDLGWKDPYSLEAATQRQAAYGARFGDGSYTPEMVVDGRKGFVGSNRVTAEQIIAAAKRSDPTAAKLALTRRGGGVSIEIGSGAGHADVILVGFDPRHRTVIGRGENGGRTLTESNIVRSIRHVGEWNGAAVSLHVETPPGQQAAVLLEAPDGSIIGAARSSGS